MPKYVGTDNNITAGDYVTLKPGTRNILCPDVTVGSGYQYKETFQLPSEYTKDNVVYKIVKVSVGTVYVNGKTYFEVQRVTPFIDTSLTYSMSGGTNGLTIEKSIISKNVMFVDGAKICDDTPHILSDRFRNKICWLEYTLSNTALHLIDRFLIPSEYLIFKTRPMPSENTSGDMSAIYNAGDRCRFTTSQVATFNDINGVRITNPRYYANILRVIRRNNVTSSVIAIDGDKKTEYITVSNNILTKNNVGTDSTGWGNGSSAIYAGDYYKIPSGTKDINGDTVNANDSCKVIYVSESILGIIVAEGSSTHVAYINRTDVNPLTDKDTDYIDENPTQAELGYVLDGNGIILHIGDYVNLNSYPPCDVNGNYIQDSNLMYACSIVAISTQDGKYVLSIKTVDDKIYKVYAIDTSVTTSTHVPPGKTGTVTVEEFFKDYNIIYDANGNPWAESPVSAEVADQYLTSLLSVNNPNDIIKYNMRLFGLPCQFTPYCDYRTYNHLTNKDPLKCIGRKFLENIVMEAPVITIIPGKPLYLPAAKNRDGLTYGFAAASNGNLAALAVGLSGEKLHDKLRYYDFKSDYFSYIKYVNVLCQVSATFLDLGDVELDGIKLMKYDWKNYRWNSDKYSDAMTNLWGSIKSTARNGINSLVERYGNNAIKGISNYLLDNEPVSNDGLIGAFQEDGEDKSFLEAADDYLAATNFVQFYVDARSGVSESASNTTTQSKLASMLESGESLFKEIAFIAQSGGLAESKIKDFAENKLPEYVSGITGLGNTGGVISEVLNRISNSAGSIIKGDNIIFPDIYQKSEYEKSYNITIDLRSPSGNKMSYYLNILVPLFHILALTIPKQSTANTYGSPFLIKAYYPGVFSCNLGIVNSISIEKNSSEDSWTVDGYPNQIKVTMNIKDLYSDLTLTPSGITNTLLFLSNSSLIEYLATLCGINLTVPNLEKRVEFAVNLIKTDLDWTTIKNSIWSCTLGNIANRISDFLSGIAF